MARAKSYLLNGTNYPTQISAIKACQEVMYRQTPGQKITDENDNAFLKDLLAYHPESAEKLSGGFEGFIVDAPKYFPTQRCFHILRPNDTPMDFSFQWALKGRKMDLEEKIRDACRNAVFITIHAFKNGFIYKCQNAGERPICAISGKAIELDANIQVDHYPTAFIDIYRAFVTHMTMRGISITEKDVTRDSEAHARTQFVNNALHAEFVKFHDTMVNTTGGLRIVSKGNHLKQSNTGSKRVRNRHQLLRLDYS